MILLSNTIGSGVTSALVCAVGGLSFPAVLLAYYFGSIVGFLLDLINICRQP